MTGGAVDARRVRVITWPLMAAIAASIFAPANVGLLSAPTSIVLNGLSRDAVVVGAGAAFFEAATVAFELLGPWLMQRIGVARCFAAAQAAMTAGALAVAVLPPTVPLVLGAGALRGVGFGVSVVAISVALAEVAPTGGLGRAAGVQGLFMAVPVVLAYPAGLALQAAYGHVGSFGVGAAATALGIAAVPLLPYGRPRAGPALAAGMGVVSVLRHWPVMRALLPFLAAAFVFGTFMTFIPVYLPNTGPGSALAFLFYLGLARTAGRLLGGQLSDRVSTLAATGAGLGLIAAGVTVIAAVAGPVAVAAGAIALGFGFGILHSSSFAETIAQVRRGDYVAVTAVWGVAFDAGVTVGTASMGALAAAAGYRTMFALLVLIPVVAAAAYFSRFVRRARRL